MNCSHISSCDLFVQFAMNPALDIWKEHYCQDDHVHCVRFQTAKKGLPVPLTLLPNGKLIQAKSTVEETGSTALFNAVLKNRPHMISSLIKVGVNINSKNVEGLTPTMVAAQLGFTRVISLLILHDANLNVLTGKNQTALDLAREAGHVEAAEMLEKEMEKRHQGVGRHIASTPM